MVLQCSSSSRLLLLATLLCSASAIYEDQAGTFDWYKQYVGQPKSVTFVPGKDRFYLTTAQNLLAALHTKSGGVAWRRKYTQQDSLDGAIALQRPAVVVAASQGGKYVRAWDSNEGGFRWEALVFEGVSPAGPGEQPALAAVQLSSSSSRDAKDHQGVAVAAGDKLQLLSASKGDLVWSADLEAAGAASHKLLLASSDTITVAAYTPGSEELLLVTVSAADGSLQDEQRLSAGLGLGEAAAVSGSTAALLSQDKQQLCTLVLPGADQLSCVSVSSINPALSTAAADGTLRLGPAAPGSFLLAAPSAGVAVVSASESGPELAHWFPGAAAAAAAAASSTDSDSAAAVLLLATSSPDGSSVTLQLREPVSGHELASSTLSVPAVPYVQSGPAAHVVAVWLEASKQLKQQAGGKAGPGLRGCHAVLLWSDDRLSLVSNGTLQWTREEALAAGISSTAVELPAAGAADTTAAAAAGGRGGLLGLLQDRDKLKRWVRLQVLSVLVQFRLNTELEREEFLELRQALSDNNLPYRDTNGFRKLIVLLTASGKLFGLHSGDGRILWTSTAVLPSVQEAAAAACSKCGETGGGQLHLLEWRRFHDLTHAPQLAVLSGGQLSSVLHVVNGHTGEQLQQQELAYGIDKVIPLQPPVHDGKADQLSFMLVERSHDHDQADEEAAADAGDTSALPKVRLLPDTAAARQQLSKAAGSLFFWLLQQDGKGSSSGTAHTILRGYSLKGGGEADASGVWPVQVAWQVVLPGQLLGLAARDPREPLHSYVKVLGDRSLKYKYVNPNLLFVATGTAAAEAASLAPDEHTVTAAVLNTVTGAVLHQQLHRGAAGPVQAVVSEHWVVYALRDIVALRQQVTVIELYDASPRDLSIEAVLLGRTRHSATLSSYSSMVLEVASQSFYLQHSITGLAVTQTLQGITTKQLLLSTVTDQVYALDKRFVDPRRPMRAKLTPEEVEERLMPYNELVIFSTLAYPTQDKQVLNLRGVTAFPAVLESTTLLFCYGSDLFYTRLTPAQHFDSLQSDFSYGLLVVALVALVGGTWFAAYTSQQTLLKAKWQ